MYWLRIILIALILPWLISPPSAVFFHVMAVCFSLPILISPTKFIKHILVFGFNNLGQIKYYSDGNFNGLGFNPKDNYIYAVRTNSNEIVRIKGR